MPVVIYVLAMCVFSMTTSEFMVVGMMPSLAVSLGVSVSSVGYLVSAFAGGVVVGGPILAVLLFKTSNKHALLILASLFCLSQAIGAVAMNYNVMLFSRILSGVVHSAFFGVALSVCASLAGPERIGRASAIVMGGLMVASVIGLPAATWLDQYTSWRMSFWIISGLMLLGIIACATLVPKQPVKSSASLKQEIAALGKGELWAACITSGLVVGAVFAMFTYLFPILTQVTGFSPTTIPVLLAMYGAATVVGIMIVGRIADRYTMRILFCGQVILITLLVTFALNTESMVISTLALLLTGLVGLPMNPALATRVMRLAKNSYLVNTIYIAVSNVGIVVGSWVGGLAIAEGYGLRSPLWIGGILAAFGLLSILPFLTRHSARAMREKTLMQ
ncbi:MFS transporter [Erwinia rhapontici]|uniref:MFS transporter n=1 Tax=Erwinia rhapontici TaxID=55212 RepID=UPI001BB410A5|nr:MFS transporter [Erwinia rhapontici]BCQ40831.1 MFS transporter [Erwinia rhapontici]